MPESPSNLSPIQSIGQKGIKTGGRNSDISNYSGNYSEPKLEITVFSPSVNLSSSPTFSQNLLHLQPVPKVQF